MCQAFQEVGHEVVLLVPAVDKYDRDLAEIFGFYGIDRRFEIKWLPWIPARGRNHVFGFLAARTCLELHTNLVYGRHLPACYFAARAGLAVAFEAHYPVEDSASMGTRFYFRGMIRRPAFQRLVVISEALRREYERRHPFLAGEVLVAPDGAERPDDEIAPAWKAEEGVLQVAYIGHLYPGKGMEVISRLPARCPWAHFHIVGGTPDEVATWSRRLECARNVTIHGFVPPARLGAYRKAADVLLAPYQRRVLSSTGRLDVGAWMSPLKVFEYMAAGKAIIASDLPILREVLNEANAELVDPEDLDAWVEALGRLRDPGRRGSLGAAALADFEGMYEWSRRGERILEACVPGLEGDVGGT